MYKHILFIEDEVGIAEIYARMLGVSGYEVVCKYDGETGLQEALANKYDLILLDLMLPNISGYEILKKLRDNTQSPQFDQSTDIFMLTNFDMDDVTKRDVMTMAQQYLIKVDITPRVLVNVLKEAEYNKQQASLPKTPPQEATS